MCASADARAAWCRPRNTSTRGPQQPTSAADRTLGWCRCEPHLWLTGAIPIIRRPSTDPGPGGRGACTVEPGGAAATHRMQFPLSLATACTSTSSVKAKKLEDLQFRSMTGRRAADTKGAYFRACEVNSLTWIAAPASDCVQRISSAVTCRFHEVRPTKLNQSQALSSLGHRRTSESKLHESHRCRNRPFPVNPVRTATVFAPGQGLVGPGSHENL